MENGTPVLQQAALQKLKQRQSLHANGHLMAVVLQPLSPSPSC